MLLLLLMLTMLASTYLLTNSLENLALYFKLSDGFTGSILIAIATATPELIIPFIAIGYQHHDIGVGAILGSPLMLIAVAFPICGLVAFLARPKQQWLLQNAVINTILNLKYIGYGLLLIVINIIIQFYLHYIILNILLILIPILLYLSYLWANYKISKQYYYQKQSQQLIIGLLINFIKNNNFSHQLLLIIVQLILSLLLIIALSKMVIEYIASLHKYNLPEFVSSSLLIPILTELPEQFNIIFYILKKKDTLAISNIMGAIVLQSLLLPITSTYYNLWASSPFIPINLLSIILSYCWLWLIFLIKKQWHCYHLIVPILFYILNVILIFTINNKKTL